MDKINLLELQALVHINDIQETFDYIQDNINIMKAELGKAGFEVEFERVSDRVRVCDSGEKILKADDSNIHHIAIPTFHAGGFLNEANNNLTVCKVKKKNNDNIIIKTKAEVTKEDLNIKLLGEYLSLARATRIVLGDYNDN
jgi:hypothetical protein